jgi:hypothetical protein
VAFFSVLTFLGVNWHYSEQIETQKSTIDNAHDRIQSQTDRIIDLQRQLNSNVKPAPAISVPSSTAVKRLSEQSNSDLRDNASEFVESIRQFDAAFEIEDQRIQDADWNEIRSVLPGNNPDRLAKTTETGNQMYADLAERRKEHEEDFNIRFRPMVLAYINEMCKREEGRSPCEVHLTKREMSSGIIDSIAEEIQDGLLAGIHPIMQIADYIDKLIRNLPN